MRFPFAIERTQDGAIVAMDCDGLVRARHMPLDLLSTLGELCEGLQEKAAEMLSGLPVPDYPSFLPLVQGTIDGACEAIFGVHRLDGKTERVIAVYDEGDREAPVLCLTEEQIDDFIRQARG